MTDYSDAKQSAYAGIAAKGGVIKFKQPPQDTAPADPDKPWEGNSNDPVDFEHVAVLLPLGPQKNDARSNHRVLIPALNLPFIPQMEQVFTDDAGGTYSLTAIGRLAPDPAQIILFDCECAAWPGT